MPEHKKIFFVTDFHFGMPDAESSRVRENKLVRWLDSIAAEAEAIFIMGDMFDFWFEYKRVVPKGYVRLLGKLADMVDKGIDIHLFRGNHDIWAFSYLETEVGIKLHRKAEVFDFGGKRFFLEHGDGRGPGDTGFKILKRIFENRVCQWLFRLVHPDLGIGCALRWSSKHRMKKLRQEKQSKLKNEELPLYIYAQSVLKRNPDLDYLVFGHRHTPLFMPISDKAQLLIVGNWLFDFTYAVFDGDKVELKHFDD